MNNTGLDDGLDTQGVYGILFDKQWHIEVWVQQPMIAA